jgi:peptide deformylase
MFPVIMRLFNSSGVYKKLILDSLDYMMEITTKKFKDYPEVKGISGANVGIPFNLVVMKVCKIGDVVPEDLKGMTIRYKGYHFLHMINPKIEDHSTKVFKPLTNCGSLRLERQIRIERYYWVQVSFYDRDGKKCRNSIERPISGTAQHEIDHNNGVLITDREVKVGEENDRS